MTLNVGDRVMVIQEGKQYNSYLDWKGWASFNQDHYKRCTNNMKGKIINIAPHNDYPETIIALVQFSIKHISVINVDGLKVYRKGKPDTTKHVYCNDTL